MTEFPPAPWETDTVHPPAPWEGDAAPAATPKEQSFGLKDTWPARLATGIYETAKSAFTAPHDAYAGQFAPAPQNPGMLTEEDVFRQDTARQGEVHRALDMATVGNPQPAASRAGAGFMGVPRPAPAVPSTGAVSPIAEASERLGVPIPRAAATQSIPLQATAGALKEIPVVGSPLVKASREALTGLDAAAEQTARGYGSGEPFLAGQVAEKRLEGWITDKSKDVAERLYGAVDPLVDPQFVRPLHATADVVADIMAKRANSRISGKSAAVDEVLDAVKDPNGLNYEGLKGLRTYIRDLTPQQMIAKNINQGEAKRIYGALTEDLRGTILDAGGPDALAKFDKANRVYGLIAERRGDLAKIIGTKADAAPEKVVDRIVAMAGSKGGADYQRLVQARRAMGPEAWNEVTAAFVNKMGRDKPGAEFSGDRFATSWSALPDKSKRLLFNSTGRTDLAKSVEDIVTLSAAHKSLMRFGNPSGTGRVATLFGMAAAVLTNPLKAISLAVGGNGLARVLASPVTAKPAADWSRAYVAASQTASPVTQRLLANASVKLIGAINRQSGTNLSPLDLFRGMQGPAIGRADEDENSIPRPPSQKKHGGAVRAKAMPTHDPDRLKRDAAMRRALSYGQ